MPWFMSLAPQNLTLKTCMANSILGHRRDRPPRLVDPSSAYGELTQEGLEDVDRLRSSIH